MKQIHCTTPHPKSVRDLGFGRYFHSAEKSPHVQFNWNAETATFDLIRWLKNPTTADKRSRLIWDSWTLGTRRKSVDPVTGKVSYYSENNRAHKIPKPQPKKMKPVSFTKTAVESKRIGWFTRIVNYIKGRKK